MAFDPKKWTVKTNEAFSAAIERAKANHNPELTPDHLMVALAGQDDTLVPPLLSKLGIAQGTVREKAEAAEAADADATDEEPQDVRTRPLIDGSRELDSSDDADTTPEDVDAFLSALRSELVPVG